MEDDRKNLTFHVFALGKKLYNRYLEVCLFSNICYTCTWRNRFLANRYFRG